MAFCACGKNRANTSSSSLKQTTPEPCRHRLGIKPDICPASQGDWIPFGEEQESSIIYVGAAIIGEHKLYPDIGGEMDNVVVIGVVLVMALAISCHASSELPAAHHEVITSTTYDVDEDGATDTLEVLLTSGRRYTDHRLWCGLGDKWEGSFEIRLRRGDCILSSASVNGLVGQESLFFHAPHFELVLQDLNADGRIDFNLGFYSGCNGNKYYLFTVSSSGEIQRLGSGAYYVFDHRNSTPLIQHMDGLVGFPHYSQSSGSCETFWYKWDGSDFNQVRTTTSPGLP